jgi:hypothetical protein
MVDDQRTERFDVRVTPRESEMLREIAEYQGLSQSDTLRQLIREKHAALFGPPKPKKARRRR